MLCGARLDLIKTRSIDQREVTGAEDGIVLDDDEGEVVRRPLDNLEVKPIIINGQHALTNLRQHALLKSAAAEVPVQTSAEGPDAVADLAAVHSLAEGAGVAVCLAAERAENLLLNVLTDLREDVIEGRGLRQQEVSLVEVRELLESLSAFAFADGLAHACRSSFVAVCG